MQTATLLALAFIMFSLGTTLRGADFAALLSDKKAFGVAVACHMILLPGLGFSIAAITHLPPALAVGLVLIASCPSGATSNYLTYLARGDVAMAVTLTVISGITTVLTLPFYLWLAARWFADFGNRVHIDFVDTLRSVVLLTLLPVLLGMGLRRMAPVGMQRAQGTLAVIAGVTFAAIIAIAWSQQWKTISTGSAQAIGAVVALNVLALTAGEIIGRTFGLSVPRRTTLILETGIQNGALAVGIALFVLHQAPLAVPAALYSIVMIISGLSVVAWRRRGAAVPSLAP